MKNLIMSQLDASRIRQLVAHRNGNDAFSGSDVNKLLQEINQAKLVEPKKVPSDVITMNSIVKIKNVKLNKSFTIHLVYPSLANTKEGKISIFAPIATALLGYRQGDRIEWEIPAGKTELLIEEIIYQPESAGDYDL
jgi:regulator of nucleoside diphosphate kinase